MGGSSLVIVCALEFERGKLARVLGRGVEIVCAGPGGERVGACVDRVGERGVGRVILAGVAGGLRETEVCPPIGRVVDRAGRAWTPSVVGADGVPVTVLGVDAPVTEPDEKAALGAAHDADLVDCESHAFAARATELGMRWGVVRGVSDGPGERLDPRILAWTDERGRTRLRAVAADMARHPELLAAARRLGRRSAAAMEAVARRVDATARAMEGDGDD